MNETLRLGILGPGKIARRFLNCIHLAPGVTAVAVGSRSLARAQELAAEYAIPHAYGSYEEAVSDPDVDAVYVATLHPQHEEHALLALRAGKHVLVEKPFTLNEASARRIAQEAQSRGLFCMEAMWTRFFPVMDQVRAWISAGAIGDVRLAHAQFCFRSETVDPNSRLFSPLHAGGCTLDVGVYGLSFLSMVFGGAVPEAVSGYAHIGETGVDEQAVMILKYGGGALGSAFAAFRTRTPSIASVYGTAGRIDVADAFWSPRSATLVRAGQPDEVFEDMREGEGFQYEMLHVRDCLQKGLKDSPLMPLGETLTLQRTMDALRAQWGLSYPCE